MARIKEFFKSFAHAFRGLKYAIINERNFQNELLVAIIAFGAMLYYRVTRLETIVIITMVMAVLVMEMLNTIVERIIDILKPSVHPYARLIKDLMAASVLLTSIMALIIGLVIFIPYVF
ncbi:MAG: diacylglycerol kinase [Candidatus Moranbacteria bacterium CG23_combo_of_CG06-09_8_20_14_all_35_22]|nr:MAG: diacylglycerol kinase [Candidatus Moranbacteria bacterium CG23_combo_of_CG06-09_8_20_14_all_35_22]